MRIIIVLCSLSIVFQTLFSQTDEKSFEKSSLGLMGKRLTTYQTDTSGYDILNYRLELDFPFSSSAFSGVVTITGVVLREGLDSIDLDMVDLSLDSVLSLQGGLTGTHHNEKLTMTWPKSWSSADTFQFSIAYHGAPEEEGFYFYENSAYTMSEPIDARRWFPCRDVPWDKATGELIITVPTGIEVASNGLLLSRMVHPEQTKETFHWKTEYPMATYLFCVTMSDDYAVWSDWYISTSGDSIQLPYYVFREDSANAVHDNIHIINAMQFFSDKFGDYPFEKYGIAGVSDNAWFGGMEHQTMSSIKKGWFRGDLSYEDGFVHELAHMWWGDAVTLMDWPDIWLNEGFATYTAGLFRQHYYGEEEFLHYMINVKESYLNQSQNYDFPVYDPPEDKFFNSGIVYSKGAFVLHMLRHMTGESLFWNILKTYYQRFEYKNASTEQFIQICEEVYGSDLNWFFDQWIYGKDYPRLDFNWYHSTVSMPQLVVKIEQSIEQDRIFKFLLDLRFYFNDTYRDTSVWIRDQLEIYSFDMPLSPDSVTLDPDHFLIFKINNDTSMYRRGTNVPKDFRIIGNFPNPFNMGTQIHYDIPSTRSVWPLKLIIYDMLGRSVRTLIDDPVFPGAYWMFWDGRTDQGVEASSGIYVAHLSSDSLEARHKLLLVR